MKVAIIGAMDKEIERYLELYNPELVDEKRKIYIKDSIVIAGSGIGKVNSAIMTEHLIDKYNADVIISSGCAGSLTNDLNVLDVIIPSYVTYHDFLPERVMRYSVPDEGNITVDENLRELFKKVIVSMENVHYGKCTLCRNSNL